MDGTPCSEANASRHVCVNGVCKVVDALSWSRLSPRGSPCVGLTPTSFPLTFSVNVSLLMEGRDARYLPGSRPHRRRSLPRLDISWHFCPASLSPLFHTVTFKTFTDRGLRPRDRLHRRGGSLRGVSRQRVHLYDGEEDVRGRRRTRYVPGGLRRCGKSTRTLKCDPPQATWTSG